MLCKNCKKEIRDGSDFCRYCGHKVEKEAEFSFCTSCGKQIKNDAMFCKHCGTSVGKVVNVTEKDSKYNKKNVAAKIIAVALVMIVCFSLFPRGEKKDDKQTGGYTHTGTGNTGRDIINPGPQGLSGKDDCFICGGDGKKDCTSCDGGFITEYETGTYMGYGSATREKRTKCKVCKGDGEVKCYH